MATTLYVPLGPYVNQLWPRDLLELPSLDALEGVWLEPFDFDDEAGLTIWTALLFQTELSVGIPGLDAVRLVFAPSGSNTAFTFEVEVEPRPEFRVLDIPIALRLESSLFRPVRRVPPTEPGKPETFEHDPDVEFVDINLGTITLRIDSEGNIAIDARASISLSPTMIADTGVVIEASDIGIYFDSNTPPPGKSSGWRGIHIAHLNLYLPSELAGIVGNLSVTNAYIGNGGFSGSFTDVWRPPLAARLFGAEFSLNGVDITFVQNALTASSIRGMMTLPFFDQPLGVDIAISVDGSMGVALSAVQPDGVTNQSGLVTFTKENLFKLTVESLGFEFKDDLFTTKLSGQIKPEFGVLDWPTFQVKELAIDSDGNVHLDGGWLDLRDQYSLDFHGFKIEITKLGFGKAEDGGKWIGFSGGLKLVDGFSAGASVEGLRITWYDGRPNDTKITLNGVGVEFEVPDVLRFKGAVSYRELNVPNPDGVIEKVHRFDGDIKLELISLDLQIDAKLVIGSASGEQGTYTFFAIYLGVELPAGIPLFSTGLALYGVAGLFALEMEPNKGAPPNELHPASRVEEEWYENADGSQGWYKRDPIGVTDLLSKWDPHSGSLAFGAGVTIGTLADNGFTFAGKLLLVIVFPGPILLIEGKANLLKERAELSNDAVEPIFRALAVLDNREGTYLIGLDAQYKYGDKGELIDIRGGVEAFFSFTDASLWHLYLGEKEPREQRIRAEIFSLFEAQAYFMLDANQAATGAWIGFDEDWKFGPLRASLEAWIEGNAIISWKPAYFHTDLWLHGKAELSAFGFGIGISADAQLAADIFDPFHILGELSVAISLPLIPDIEADITLEWGPEPDPPPLPLPLKEIAIEHFKVTTSWPLPRGELLLPDYDDPDNHGFRRNGDPTAPPPELDQVPVVPLDCRPHVTFGRTVHDDALIGGNPQPPDPEYEVIGDPANNEGPAKVRYGLKEVALHKHVGDVWEVDNWELVARKAARWDEDEGRWVVVTNDDDVGDLFGSWAPVPSGPNGNGKGLSQVKLWLWSKNPFDYTRHGGRAWDEWFTDRYPEYPCVGELTDQEFCYDFENFDPGMTLVPPWGHPDEPGLVFNWNVPGEPRITILESPVEGRTRALCFPNNSPVTIELPEAATEVRFIVTSMTRVTIAGTVNQVVVYGGQENPTVVVSGDGITHVTVQGVSGATCIVAVCFVIPPDPAAVTLREQMAQHLVDEMARWEHEGDVLEPHTTYRLKVVTTLDVKDFQYDEEFNREREQIEYAYFRTEGPPGLANLSLPIGAPNEDTVTLLDKEGNLIMVDGSPSERPVLKSDLNDLVRYVRQTVPATVPAAGEKPRLPRPVYRAYDVGVEFNEDYVDLMYRMERRDLGLYLFDNNNRPVRDAQGRLIVLNNRWGVLEKLTLTESEERYITIVNAGDCANLPQEPIPHDKTVTSAAEGQVLDPDTLYEARLVPLLLHEDFSEDLARWEPVNEGENDRPEEASNWEVRGHKTLKGSGATVAGAVVNLENLPDLSVLDPDFDVIILGSDTARPSQLYQIVTFDDDAKTVTVDGEPLLSNGRSAWEIPGLGAIVQTSNIWGGNRRDREDPNKPGTMLLLVANPNLGDDHPDQPSEWTDYRFSVLLRIMAPEDDAIGVVFRYQDIGDSGSYYRFSMDREGKYRRLVRVVDGHHTILDEDDFVYRQDQDYLITVEAIGSSLRVYQDGVLVFDVTDDSMESGKIGLYCWGNSGARFSDVRVDDFRKEAPVVYRFKFTTSQFTNFFHHLHSFQDETWRVSTDADIGAELAEAVSPTTPPSEEEARAYESLATLVLGQAAQQNPPEVQMTRVEQNEETVAFLVQSPEPVDWKRTNLEVLHAERQAPRPELPGAVKLTDVTFGTNQPNEESVTLLLREASDPTGHRIEYRLLPGPVAEPQGDPVLFVDEFDGSEAGLLFREEFGPNALDHYEVEDEGTEGPSAWDVFDGHIVQTGTIFGGRVSGNVPDKPGTIALTGSSTWANVRVRATLRSETHNAIGLVFRYQDADNYYRFSMDRQRGYRRLIKKVGGIVSAALWEDSIAYNRSQSYHLLIEAYDDRLLGYLDDALLFSVEDPDIRAGRVGFYCWLNPDAHFEALEVEALERDPMLWQPAFQDLSEVEVVNEAEAVEGPSQWAVVDGVLTQSSNIHVRDDEPGRRATYALGGSTEWRDVQISVRLRSDDNDAIGVMFRYQDGDNYYRFSMDRDRSYRRLIKKIGGIVTVLQEDHEQYTVGQSYELTLRSEGSEASVYVNGVLLFTTRDTELKQGRVGLYCWGNTGARFERVVVTDRTRRVGHWTIHDEGTVSAPSVWRLSEGAFLQTANIYGGSAPAYPGSDVVAGDPAWKDYRLTVGMRSDDDDAIGIIFRYMDDDNYYRLSIDSQRNYRRLIKNENGVVSDPPLWEDTGSYTQGEPFTLTVDAIGSRLVGYTGDERLFEIRDSSHPAGQVGLYCWGNTGARFERVEVRRPPLEAYALLRDRFADNDTSDWTFMNEGTEGGPANWAPFEGTLRQTSNIYTPPNNRNTLSKRGTQAVAGDPTWTDVVVSVRLESILDNDAIGLLFRYSDENNYYRFSMDSQRGYRRLVKNVSGTFTLLWEDAVAYEVGRAYELTVVAIGSTLRGYMDGVPMFVVEDHDPTLTTGHIGLYCWGNEDARFSHVCVYPADHVFNDWLLDEPFVVLIPDRWTDPVDEGSREQPSHWEVINGEFRQTSNIYGETIDESTGENVPEDKPGTHVLAGDATWTDYRVSVRLRSEDNDAIGVMFRYQDGDNYYRFSMDRQRRYRRLIKKVGGVVSVLSEDAVQYTLGREYVLTLDCIGEQLTGYLDGVQLFSEQDSDLATGRIGLYCWGNTGACFAEVRVAAPVWVPYYVFEREARLPAGTCVRIYAGNVADAPPEELGVVQCFKASLDERGQIRFPANGVDLRVGAAGSTVGHTRRFLPENDYDRVESVRVLRKADGTGFFLLPQPGVSMFTEGQYRLKLTYRRDNRAAEPDSQVFTEAGNRDSEPVTLDILWQAH